MMESTRYYYPPGSSPEDAEHCGFIGGHVFRRRYPGGCKLVAGHGGDHDPSANWAAHVEVEPVFGECEVAFRSWHDTRALHVRSRGEADALLSFLRTAFDEVFGHSTGAPS